MALISPLKYSVTVLSIYIKNNNAVFMPVFLVGVFKGLAKANSQTLETHGLKAVDNAPHHWL